MENVCTITQIRLGEGGGGGYHWGGGVGEPRTGIIYGWSFAAMRAEESFRSLRQKPSRCLLLFVFSWAICIVTIALSVL